MLAVTTRVKSQLDIMAVELRRNIELIDFKRKKDGIPATVIGIEYDPNRTANIALICYADGEKAYILAPAGINRWHDSYGMVLMLRSELVTAYHLRISQLVHRYTTLSYIQVRAGQLSSFRWKQRTAYG